MHQNFYGREGEIHLLFEAWLQAMEGKPQWVALVAETGTGKTRLIQEFYRYISDRAYRQLREIGNPEISKYQVDYDAANYWPESLPIETNRLGLNPNPEGISTESIESLKDIPWLWWGLRGQDPGRRNPSESGCAARDALSHLELHTTILAVQKARVEANLAAAKEIGKYVISQIPVVGSMFEIAFTIGELVHSGKRPLENLINGLGIRVPAERKKLQIKLQDLLVDSIFRFLDQNVPVVLVLDDVQWFDSDTVAFIDKLTSSAADKSLRLMIISTSWAREWEESEIRGVFERFHGTHQLRSLGGIESDHATAFLMSNFLGLSLSDQKLLVDRANGNFRYLTELVMALAKDPRRYFANGNVGACLSSGGREKICSKQLEMDQLVEDRFLDLELRVQQALMRSSCQGSRFDPRLTSQVTQSLEQTAGDCEASTIEAINLAERPGSMVCLVEGDLREFLQGPYWRLIRQRQEEESAEFFALQEVYRGIVLQGDRAIDDSILESLLMQWIEQTEDHAEKILFRAWLLDIAARTKRYQAGLRQLREIAASVSEEGLEDKIHDFPPAVALAALRIFNQYAFGAGGQEDRESLKDLCSELAIYVLQIPIWNYLEEQTLPKDRNLSDLVEWCEALVSFRHGLGHIPDHMIWLRHLCELQEAQFETEQAAPGARLRHGANILHLAEMKATMAEGRQGWDDVFETYRWAMEQVQFLRAWEYSILWASIQISVIYFGRPGRSHYPETQNWGNDYNFYCQCANKLGDVLAEIEGQGTDTPSCTIDDFNNEILEVMLHATALTLELADARNYPLASEFLDRLVSVTQSLFMRIQNGGYIPISLAHAAMDADLAAVLMLSKLANSSEIEGKSDAAVISGVEVIRIQSRRVSPAEALQTIKQITATVDRYRQLSMLSVDMLRIFARVSIVRLQLSEAGLDDATETFIRIVDDAILARDGERAVHGEPVQLLDLLVRIFDRWLKGASESDTLWKRLRAGYSICSDGVFDSLVEMIRESTLVQHAG